MSRPVDRAPLAHLTDLPVGYGGGKCADCHGRIPQETRVTVAARYVLASRSWETALFCTDCAENSVLRRESAVHEYEATARLKAEVTPLTARPRVSLADVSIDARSLAGDTGDSRAGGDPGVATR